MGFLQPKWPLKYTSDDGPYNSFLREEVALSLHQDLEILLKTNPGEWPMRPNLGIGIETYLFENPNSARLLSLKSNIKKQVNRFLPSIDITDVKINTDPELIDRNEASITITYFIKPLDLVGSMNINADGWTTADDLLVKALQNQKAETTLKRSF